MNDESFVTAARSYIGTPWRDRGRSRAGIDCIGLLAMSARACGLEGVYEKTLGSPRNYHVLKPVLCEFAERITEARYGAILLYLSDNPKIIHAAISTEKGQAIQVLGPGNKVAEFPLNFVPRQVWGIKWLS